ncbi:MAG: CocE/NonD family hydrolase [Gemmatimonadales bacterium]
MTPSLPAGVVAATLLSVLATLQAGAQSAPRFPVPDGRYDRRAVPSVFIPMRDGVRLATDLYFPIGAPEPYPTVLLRTPYDKTGAGIVRSATRFVAQGYVAAIQDIRGKFQSEGVYAVTAPDRQDGHDTIDWLARQPWSNGKVGTTGCSYLGETQVTAAASRHPAHAAMIPQAASNVTEMWSAHRGGLWRGGALELSSGADWLRNYGAKVRPILLPNTDSADFRAATASFRLGATPPAVDFVSMLRTLPLLTLVERMGAPPSDWPDLISLAPGDPRGERFGFITVADRFDTPALFFDSWYDYGPTNTLRLLSHLRAGAASERTRAHIHAVIGPTTHCAYERAGERTIVGRRDVGDARFDVFGLQLAWLDHWVKGARNGIDTLPPIWLYVMGRNIWRAEREWPLARAVPTSYYLHSDGRANGRFGTGELSLTQPRREPPDVYVYDPASPVPSTGGPDFGANNPELPPGGLDQRPVEMRHDVLVYTTPPLERGVEVTGPVTLVLYVSSDAPDTDFTGKLVDVDPEGRAFNVTEGILRARYREGFDRAVMMTPGQVHRLEVDLEVTSNYFRAGHRIRLEVSSSNFPRFDRNLNTGGDNVSETDWRMARNTIHHSARHPSHLLLPVIPD